MLVMNVSYISQDGKPIDITKLTQGTDFVAKVTIRNPGKRGHYTQMALSQIFPIRLGNIKSTYDGWRRCFKSSASTYQDVRDDRVYTYFNIGENETLTYYVQLNASYLGDIICRLPFAKRCMITALLLQGGKWIEVINQ